MNTLHSKFILYALVLMGQSNCSTNSIKNMPIAQFTYSVEAGARVIFSNTSQNATSYQWDYGDGSPRESVSSPTHTYTRNGTFIVTLVSTRKETTATTSQNLIITNANTNEGVFSFNEKKYSGTISSIYNASHPSNVDVLITDPGGMIIIIYNMPTQSSGIYTIKDGYSSLESVLYVSVSTKDFANTYGSANGGVLTKTGPNSFTLSCYEYDISNSSIKYEMTASGYYPNPL
ncbi:MAG: PKD domain-containing protein [Bacteroidetes bacterium]|nr:PKD domain-containing protein [Bacteroidota bacterium]